MSIYDNRVTEIEANYLLTSLVGNPFTHIDHSFKINNNIEVLNEHNLERITTSEGFRQRHI